MLHVGRIAVSARVAHPLGSCAACLRACARVCGRARTVSRAPRAIGVHIDACLERPLPLACVLTRPRFGVA